MPEPKISVIIPVYNAAGVLKECLSALYKTDYQNLEVIVIDDASTDSSFKIATSFPCNVISLKQNIEASGARNKGVKESKGDILVFIDADIIVKRDSLRRISDVLQQEDLAAVVGIYSAQHRNRDIFSQYKNLWIRYTYLRSPKYISWIFTSITGIKKEYLLKNGGFNPRYISETGIDDIEFGLRLSEKGYKILLEPLLEVEHLKKFSLKSLIRNQYIRSRTYSGFSIKTGRMKDVVKRGRFANISVSFIFSIITAFLILITTLFSFFLKDFIYAFFILLSLYILLNLPFLLFFKKHYTFWTTFRVLPILFIDHFVCGIGIMAGIINFSKEQKTVVNV